MVRIFRNITIAVLAIFIRALGWIVVSDRLIAHGVGEGGGLGSRLHHGVEGAHPYWNPALVGGLIIAQIDAYRLVGRLSAPFMASKSRVTRL